MPSPHSLSAAMLGLAHVCPPMAEAQGLELGQVLIGAEDQSDEDQGIEDAKARLDQVPGGTNVVDMRRPLQGRVASNQDVLAYQPGIYAQSAGNEGVKISIRGSGINRAPGPVSGRPSSMAYRPEAWAPGARLIPDPRIEIFTPSLPADCA